MNEKQVVVGPENVEIIVTGLTSMIAFYEDILKQVRSLDDRQLREMVIDSAIKANHVSFKMVMESATGGQPQTKPNHTNMSVH